MKMTVRRLTANESDFLSEMLYEAIFIPEGHTPLPKAILKEKSLSRYFENWAKDNFDIALVVEVDNELVGAIWGRLFPDENRGFGYLDSKTPEISMAIKQEYRNQGIGTKLINAIISEYQKCGIECLSLSVDKANRASNLYKRLGFEIVEEKETAWTMKKEIR
jgi:ribosomal-protein-alanine N-acetyltransferase